MKTISNDSIDLVADPRSGRWGAYQRIGGGHIENAQMSVSYRRSGRLLTLELEQFAMKGVEQSGLDGDQRMALEASDRHRGLGLNVTWRLGPQNPILTWNAVVTNAGDRPLELEQIEMLRAGPIDRSKLGRIGRFVPFLSRDDPAGDGSVRPDPSPGEMFFFSDGWQSWSYAGVLFEGQRQPRTRMGALTRPILENPEAPRPKGGRRFSSDMFALMGHRESRHAVLTGALSEQRAFASIEGYLDKLSPGLRVLEHGDRILLEPGESFETDWFCLQFVDCRDGDPLREYLAAVARENGVRPARQAPVGWSSWYYHFGQVSPSDLMHAAEWIEANREQIPLNILQLDDGYQSEVGDWLQPNSRFANSLAGTAASIDNRELEPGLWMAPLAARPGSRVVRDHPDWLLRSRAGTPSNAGYNWDAFSVGLDPTCPGVIDHMQMAVRSAVEKWGFRYLKLDFLYSGALKARRADRKTTRAGALRKAFEAIRLAAGDETFLLGCGSPLGPAIGIFDSMRIGPDVAPRWRPSYRGIRAWFGREPSLPSARNAIRNTLTRAHFNRRWWINDPDCVILRASDTHLSSSEVEALATVVSMSGGSLIDSDHLPSLSPERLELLARLLPPLEGRLIVRDLFRRTYPEELILAQSGMVGSWFLFAQVNWEAAARSVELDFSDLFDEHSGELHGIEFWRKEYVRTRSRRLTRRIPAHGVTLMALRPYHPGAADWVGDSLHISQGAHVQSWKADRKDIHLGLALNRSGSGSVWLQVPCTPMSVEVDGHPTDCSMLSDTIMRIEINVEYASTMLVRCSPE